MLHKDDRAWTDHRAINALYRARRSAVAECIGRLVPQSTIADLLVAEEEQLSAPELWDRLSVAYLRVEWPSSKLN
jgi:hypothetical protein